jgi:hypothetical protein
VTHCDRFRDLHELLMDRALPAAEMAGLDEHGRTCPDCARWLAPGPELVEALRGLPPGPYLAPLPPAGGEGPDDTDPGDSGGPGGHRDSGPGPRGGGGGGGGAIGGGGVRLALLLSLLAGAGAWYALARPSAPPPLEVGAIRPADRDVAPPPAAPPPPPATAPAPRAEALVLSGLVRDPNDVPVPGARVRGNDGSSTVTDGAGRFFLNATRPGEGPRALLVESEAYPMRSFSMLDVPTSGAHPISTVRLLPPRDFDVLVVDSEGQPLSGAVVWPADTVRSRFHHDLPSRRDRSGEPWAMAAPPDGVTTYRTDAEGWARIRTGAVSDTLLVCAEGHLPTTRSVDAQAPAIMVLMERYVERTVQVLLEPDLRPEGEWDVIISPHGHLGGAQFGRTKADGSLRIRCPEYTNTKVQLPDALPNSRHWFGRAFHSPPPEKLYMAAIRPDPPAEEPPAPAVELRTVRGEVRGKDGTPVIGAEVTLWRRPRPEARPPAGWRELAIAWSDTDGRFEVEAPVEAGARWTAFTGRADGPMEGRLFDERGLESHLQDLPPAAEGAAPPALVASEGRYPTRAGFVPRPYQPNAAPPVPFEVRCEKGCRLQGIRASLMGAHPDDPGRKPQPEHGPVRTTRIPVGKDGRGTVLPLHRQSASPRQAPDQPLRLELVAWEHDSAWLPLSPTSEAPLLLTVPHQPRLTGRVLLEDGSPAKGALVGATASADISHPPLVPVDEEGRYDVPIIVYASPQAGADPRQYVQLIVEHPLDLCVRVSVPPAARAAGRLDVVIRPPLQFEVKEEDGRPVKGARCGIRLLGEREVTVGGETDADGRVRIRNPGPGKARLWVTRAYVPGQPPPAAALHIGPMPIESLPRQVVLREPSELAIRCENRDGTPPGQVFLYLTGPDGKKVGHVSTGDGTFHMLDAAEGKYALTAKGKDDRTGTAEFTMERPRTDVVVKLAEPGFVDRSYRLAVRVLDAEGAPRSSVPVLARRSAASHLGPDAILCSVARPAPTVRPDAFWGAFTELGFTDADGRLECTLAEGEGWLLLVGGAGSELPPHVALVTDRFGAKPDSVELRPVPGTWTLRGRRKGPGPHVPFRVESTAYPDAQGLRWFVEVTPDMEGRFRVPHLPPGAATVHHKAHSPPLVVTPQSAEAPELEIE